MFGPSILDQIRAASDIVEIIGASVPLKRAGANFVGLCPFHREKTPSFNVNPHKQIFHCFGCHKGGDVFTWIKDYESVSFAEAVQRLAERAKIPLVQDQDPNAKQRRFLKDALLDLHEQLTKRWQMALHSDAASQPARNYLMARGVSEDAIQLFRLGYAPDAWDDTLNWSRSKGFDAELVEQAGLIIKRDGGEGFYDRFRGRLMFPIADEQGRIIGFSGRVLDPNAKAAKYVNSPETPIFTKGRVFYGLDKSKRGILEAKSAVLCEGQLDLIACFMAGIKNVIAPQGTAFTSEHARILRRYTEEVILCFDGDSAGQNATVRIFDELLESGLAARVAVIPAPHDPDSFIKNFGAEAFQALLASAQGFFDFLLGRLCSLHSQGGDRGRLAILKGMGEAVVKTSNAMLIDTYAQKTAQRLGVSVDAVRLEFRKLGRVQQPSRQESGYEADEETSETEGPPATPPTPAEASLLALAFNQDELVSYLASTWRPEWVSHAGIRHLLERRFALEESGSWQGVASFLNGIESQSLKELVTKTVAAARPPIDVVRETSGILTTLRNTCIDRQLNELKRQIAGGVDPHGGDYLRLIREMEALRAEKRTAIPGIQG